MRLYGGGRAEGKKDISQPREATLNGPAAYASSVKSDAPPDDEARRRRRLQTCNDINMSATVEVLRKAREKTEKTRKKMGATDVKLGELAGPGLESVERARLEKKERKGAVRL